MEARQERLDPINHDNHRQSGPPCGSASPLDHNLNDCGGQGEYQPGHDDHYQARKPRGRRAALDDDYVLDDYLDDGGINYDDYHGADHYDEHVFAARYHHHHGGTNYDDDDDEYDGATHHHHDDHDGATDHHDVDDGGVGGVAAGAGDDLAVAAGRNVGPVGRRPNVRR